MTPEGNTPVMTTIPATVQDHLNTKIFMVHTKLQTILYKKQRIIHGPWLVAVTCTLLSSYPSLYYT